MTAGPSTLDESRQLCTFLVGNLLLGVPVEDVIEVVRGEHLTPVPLAPPGVVGILNLRGRIVTAVDARLRLGLAPRADGAAMVHVIVEIAGEHLSLVVDREGEVVSVVASERQDVPETLDPEIRDLLTSAYQRASALLLVLDPGLVVTVT
jgi:purine-binding chemotaxis protein CheW